MCSSKMISQLVLGVALATLGIASALAEYEPNDNYSSLVLSYKSSSFAEPVCIGTECHDAVAGPAVVFTRQLIPNLALGVSGSYLQSDGKTSSIKSSNGSVFVKGIAGLGSRVDVGASVAALRTTLELCATNPSSCSSTSESGTDLGVFGKVFFNSAGTLSLALSYDRIVYQTSANQSIVALSLVTILARHHRLTLSVDKSLDSSGNAISGGYGFGYSYLVF